MLWICDYSSRQFCDWSQSDRLPAADGDAVTNASDRVVITLYQAVWAMCTCDITGPLATQLAADTCCYVGLISWGHVCLDACTLESGRVKIRYGSTSTTHPFTVGLSYTNRFTADRQLTFLGVSNTPNLNFWGVRTPTTPTVAAPLNCRKSISSVACPAVWILLYVYSAEKICQLSPWIFLSAIRYDTIRKKRLMWTKTLSDQLNL